MDNLCKNFPFKELQRHPSLQN